jgi:PLAT/LH2 domain
MRRRITTLLVGTALLTTSLGIGQQPAIADTTKKARSAAVWYNITMRTGDVRYGGTDDDVFIVLYGSRGRSQVVEVDNAEDNFERNKTDLFRVLLNDIGVVNRIGVYRNGDQTNYSRWNLAYVIVNGRTASYYTWIPADTWIYRSTT